jgi:hypothetical protein
MTTTRQGRRLLSGKQTVFSIRDTGYKSTDYAIAELLDNSVQADSDTVLIVLITDPKTGGQRAVENVSEIIVIDDGCGMDQQLLFDCLAFGESGRFNSRSGIGRFGMGLSQASVSQGRRVDVWSFQDTRPAEAGHVYIDLDEIEESSSSELDVLEPSYPGDPEHEALPDWIDELYPAAGMKSVKKEGVDVRSGTIVRWSKLDRLRWVRAGAIKQHTERTLGRIYRRFLAGSSSTRKVDLRLAIVARASLNTEATALQFTSVRPTDPLFLHRPVDVNLGYWEREPLNVDSTDKLIKVRHVPMFRPYPAGPGPLPSAVEDDPASPWPAANPQTFTVETRPDSAASQLKGEKFDVEVRASMCRIDAQPGRYAGRDTYQGRIARDQAGISVMRADRELCIETTLATDATDRWWGLELSFGAELDEVFGVTNNKQDVPYFTQALKMCRDFPGTTVAKAVEQGLFDESHPIYDLWPIAQYALARRNAMNAERKADKNSADKSTSKKQPGVVSGVSKQKANRTDVLPPSEKAKKFEEEHPDHGEQSTLIREQLKEKHGDHLTDEQINAIVELRDANFVVQVHEKHVPETDAVFWPEETGNLNIAWVNTAHPAHDRLLTPLRVTDEKLQATSLEGLRKLAAIGADAVGMLILMWCEMEIDDPNGRHTLKQTRERWGAVIKNILTNTDIMIDEELLASLDDKDDD